MEEMTRVSLRMPKSLREWLEAQADVDHRNLNQQIVHLLEAAKQAPDRRPT